MCYDIIALLFPQYFPPEHVAVFRRYWNRIFPVADRILVNSRTVARDVADYCGRNDLRFAEPELVPLGFEVTLRAATGAAAGEHRGRGATFCLSARSSRAKATAC